MRIVAVLLCAFWLGLGGSAYAVDDVPAIPKSWLEKKVSVEEAEALHPGVHDERTARMPEIGKPFGFMHGQWEALKAQMQAGDELWTFRSPDQSWQDLAGRAGVVLVRNGVPIKALTTMMN
jgi:hypothetical protein